jgi:hypothetical protein
MTTIQGLPYQRLTAFPIAHTLTELQKLAAHLLTNRFDAYLPTGEELDAMFSEHITDLDQWVFTIQHGHHALLLKSMFESLVENHCWFDDFLPSLNWWRMLASAALEGHNPESGEDQFGPHPTFWHHRETLSRLLRDVMLAYVPAEQELSAYSKDWRDKRAATIELLKRYRLYTRYVESFAMEVWPEMNQGLLSTPDFGFRRRVA